MVVVLCFIFVALVGVLVGVQLDRAYGPNNVLPGYAGSILIYEQDGESYLFLGTELSPEQLARRSSVVLKVETQNPQIPL